MADELVVAPPFQPVTLMTVIDRLSNNPQVNLEQLQQLLAMNERWEMNKAKAEFREAMAEFKKNPPEIIKSRTAEIRKEGRLLGTYAFADLDAISTAITDGLAKVGITHSFRMSQAEGLISVTCILSKGMYSEDGVTLTAGADTSGAKNAIQAIGSSVSYLEKYTLLAASGMSAGLPDDDGKGGDTGNKLTQEQRKARVDAMDKASTLDELKKEYKLAVEEAKAINDGESIKLFEEAKDLSKKRIGGSK